MSKKDRIQEELKELRLWRGVFIAIAFTLGSWLITHVGIFKSIKYVLGVIAEFITFFQIIIFNNRIKEKIKLLEEL